MPTFLFDEIVFGPVKSRRLGVSLGINLLPVEKKICNFDCIYCECGWNKAGNKISGGLPGRDQVFNALHEKLSFMKDRGTAPDVITYAGNGEPTLHPEFPGIIDDSLSLRDKFFPSSRVAVLSNATTIRNAAVRSALLKVDQNILKLDSAFDSTIMAHNQPKVKLQAEELINDLASFNGKLIIQTLFLKGSFEGQVIDNTTDEEIHAWLEALKKIRPSEVMIYTISRDTPTGPELKKIPGKKLKEIAALVEKLGIKSSVSE